MQRRVQSGERLGRVARQHRGEGGGVESLRVVGIQRRRPRQPLRGDFGLVRQPEGASHREVRERVERVQFQGRARRGDARRGPPGPDREFWRRNASRKLVKDSPACPRAN